MSNVFISMNRFGHTLLQTLINEHVPIAMIYTLHPKNAKTISDYHDFRPLARRHRIPLKHVTHIREAKEEMKTLRPQHIFVFGWSQILDTDFLTIPTHGVVGSHPSLLPKNRGRAAIPWHIINGEKNGGLTFFYIDEGCDSGDIIAQKKFPIGPRDTATDYYELIEKAGKKILTHLAPKIRGGKQLPSRKQKNEKATYLNKRTFEDGRIKWGEGAQGIDRLVRALSAPYPRAWTTYGKKTLSVSAGKPVRTKIRSGTPGQVVGMNKRGMVVRAGRGAFVISSILEGSRPIPLKTFKLGDIFE